MREKKTTNSNRRRITVDVRTKCQPTTHTYNAFKRSLARHRLMNWRSVTSTACNESGKFRDRKKTTIIIRKSNQMNLIWILCFYCCEREKKLKFHHRVQLHKKTQLHIIKSGALMMCNTPNDFPRFQHWMRLLPIFIFFFSHIHCSFYN